jgi:hypothetical protein
MLALIGLGVAVMPAFGSHTPPPLVHPVEAAANPACADVGSTAEFEVKLDPANPGPYSVSGPGGVTITGTISSDDLSASFDVSGGRAIDVIIKGGPNANVYHYDPGVTADSALVAPAKGRSTYGISHIVYCYSNTFILAGTKYHDRNDDSARQVDFEEGLGGWTVEVYDSTDTLVASTTTNATGDYSFLLPAGDYIVCEVLESGWGQSHPANQICSADSSLGAGGHAVALQADSFGNDFGNFEVITLTCGGPAVGFGGAGVNPAGTAQIPSQVGCNGSFAFIAESWTEGSSQFTLLEILDKPEPPLIILEVITWLETTTQTKESVVADGEAIADNFCLVSDPFDDLGNLLPPSQVFRNEGDTSCLLRTTQEAGEPRVDYLFSEDIKRQLG